FSKPISTMTQSGRNAVLVLGAFLPLLAAAQPPQLISSLGPNGELSAGGGGDSGLPVLSSDGRYILFASTANNLALSASNRPFSGAIPPALNVFLRDRNTGTTRLLSADPSGSYAGNSN